ncbi:Na+/H+ antiporter family protein [Paracoccus zeaxanthinifaciens]|uniref:Na+/H+ antiporter family protein n=1 Tax=Paracoccus zeaxanthinifaciens TaxID=187400 RepID=UPI0003B7AF9D|nr:Na+/H+ antiporter NhaC family protein [Paracoccus zeaxanthinifaciens]
MNAVVVAVVTMMVLSLIRVPVIVALIVATLVGGLTAGMPITEIVASFESGLGEGATVALSYAMLGAFAVALSRSGLTHLLATRIAGLVGARSSASSGMYAAMVIYAAFLLTATLAETLVPVHIAFIPILVPPLLAVMNQLRIDRRAAACALTCGLVFAYMLLPVGFGSIYQDKILTKNINLAGADQGFEISASIVPMAMLIPSLGMLLGLLVAVVFSYRAPRDYATARIGAAAGETAPADHAMTPLQLALSLASIAVALAVQLSSGSMLLGGLVGFAVLSLGGFFQWKEVDDVFVLGLRMMALIGFIMVTAQGFAAVMQATGAVPELVESSAALIGDSKGLAAFVLLAVGLLITMGIGSSFSTVPVIALIYVPLCISFGFSPMATIALIGTAGALGDAGSPASDSTLGPTAGLNADGQHDHIRDTVVPTFLHFNLPLLAAGWIAAMVL